MRTNGFGPGMTEYRGDQRRGCACAYQMRYRPPRQDGAEPVDKIEGLDDARAYTAADGQRSIRFACHDRITGARPMGARQPATWQQRERLGVFGRVAHQLGGALARLWQQLFPRIQLGIGVNLFRFRN